MESMIARLNKARGEPKRVLMVQDYLAFERRIREPLRAAVETLNARSALSGPIAQLEFDTRMHQWVMRRSPRRIEVTPELHEWIIREEYQRVFGLTCEGHRQQDPHRRIRNELDHQLHGRLSQEVASFFVGPQILGCSQDILLWVHGHDLNILYFKY